MKNRIFKFIIAKGLLLTSLLLASAASHAGHFITVDNFGDNPGQLNFYAYQPKGAKLSAAIVVLHGCSQTAKSFAQDSGWVQIAEEKQLLLLLPEQNTANNTLRCFNWFEPADNSRGTGEARSIAQMIDYAQSNFLAPSPQVFITGLSAGGAMTGAMLATYPELFKAGAIVGGVPYNCARGLGEAYNCMAGMKTASPEQWGEQILQATNHQGPWPKISIWHAERDTVLNSKNAIEQIKQWSYIHNVDPDGSEASQSGPHKHYAYKDSKGETLIEAWLLQSHQHGWPVNPASMFGRSSGKICGQTGSYIIDADICAAYEISLFWNL